MKRLERCTKEFIYTFFSVKTDELWFLESLFNSIWKMDCKRERLEKGKPVKRFKYTPIT